MLERNGMHEGAFAFRGGNDLPDGGVCRAGMLSNMPFERLVRSILNGEVGTMLATPFTKAGFLMVLAMLAMFAFAPIADASVVRIHFSGAAGSGYADLSLQPAGINDVVDPAKVPMAVTDASGIFNGAAITGVQALNHAPPPPGEVLPDSYSLFSIPGYGDHNGVSYDNLFYPGGSPLICFVDGTLVYPFSGGFLDLMGVMFMLDNGDFVDLWSFGVTAPGFFGPFWPGGLAYGMKVIQPTENGYEVLPYAPFATATVPEPGLFWPFAIAVLGLFAWRRSAETRAMRKIH